MIVLLLLMQAASRHKCSYLVSCVSSGLEYESCDSTCNCYSASCMIILWQYGDSPHVLQCHGVLVLGLQRAQRETTCSPVVLHVHVLPVAFLKPQHLQYVYMCNVKALQLLQSETFHLIRFGSDLHMCSFAPDRAHHTPPTHPCHTHTLFALGQH